MKLLLHKILSIRILRKRRQPLQKLYFSITVFLYYFKKRAREREIEYIYIFACKDRTSRYFYLWKRKLNGTQSKKCSSSHIHDMKEGM
ncbi:hypothetical protein AQUCO_00200397v1 [Aquilegia coerulea]|uniref:Uncharacterized protein n=1 Tax=Aquilegia coerulea TaxID=218851 RepID=A0A2G5F2W3_AQUCA|nr:hypothetical protein AQUCO_00200397v1 [Aquilegia coerulea]